MSYSAVLFKILQLFLMILVGYIANRLQFFDRKMREMVTELVLNITLPGLILSSVWNDTDFPAPGTFLYLFLMVLLWYMFAAFVGKALSRLLHFPTTTRGLVEFVAMFSNVGFMGYPVIQTIFGQSGMLYTTMFNLPFNILTLTYGVLILLRDKAALQTQRRDGGEAAGSGRQETPRLSAAEWKKIFRSPAVLASAIAFFFVLTRLRVPAFLGETADTIGRITTPAAMMVTGSSLAEMRFKEMISSKWAYLTTLIRLLCMPLLTFVLLRLLIKDPIFLGVATILSGMPAASVGQMLCVRHHVNERLMARTCFLTTLGMAITIPLFATIVT